MTHYDPEKWPTMSPAERASSCRKWAAEARQFALKEGPGKTRDLFLSVATSWEKLAQEIEREGR